MNYWISVLSVFISCLSAKAISAQELNWIFKEEDDKFKSWEAEFSNSKIKAFKVETIINAPINAIAELLSDLEKMPDWYDRVSEIKIFDQINNDEAHYYIEIDLPWPVKNRFALAHCKMKQDENSVEIDIDASPLSYDFKTNNVKMEMIWARWRLTKMNEGQTRILHYGHMDPSGKVPAWIVNKSANASPKKTIKTMAKLLE